MRCGARRTARGRGSAQHVPHKEKRVRLTSPRNQATRYPNTMVSFVSWSFAGEGIPAIFQRSVFHSSKLRGKREEVDFSSRGIISSADGTKTDSPVIYASSVEENDPRSSLYQPISVDELDSSSLHRLEGESEGRPRLRVDRVDLHLTRRERYVKLREPAY